MRPHGTPGLGKASPLPQRASNSRCGTQICEGSGASGKKPCGANVDPRCFDPAPPSVVAPPWNGLQRSPLARRHTVALAALLAVGAAALGVAVSQLCQDRLSTQPHRYADATSRDLLSQPGAGTGAAPLSDSATLADNTTRMNAQAAPIIAQPAPGAALAPPTLLANIQQNSVPQPPTGGQRAVPDPVQSDTATTKPVQLAHEPPSVSRAEARAATEALTQNAITPLPPDIAHIDPTQPSGDSTAAPMSIDDEPAAPTDNQY